MAGGVVVGGVTTGAGLLVVVAGGVTTGAVAGAFAGGVVLQPASASKNKDRNSRLRRMITSLETSSD